MARARRITVKLVVVVAVVGLAVFLAVSAYAAARGAPVWLAATAGGLAFPALPVAWHAWAERRRHAKHAAAEASKQPPAKSILTGGDRLVLRIMVVGAAVIGPIVGFGGREAARATAHHLAWFWPEPPRVSLVGALVWRVPDDAEIVAVYHQDDGVDRVAGEAVSAYGHHQVMLLARGADTDTAGDVRAQLAKASGQIPWLTWGPVERLRTAPHTVGVASERWAGSVASHVTGPGPALARELARAPRTANLVLAFAPQDLPAIKAIRGGAIWVTAEQKSAESVVLHLDGRIALSEGNPGAVLGLGDALHAARDAMHFPAGCSDALAKLGELVHVDQVGAIVSVHADIPADKALELMTCGFISHH